jgi:RNA recognition motif-containing protein
MTEAVCASVFCFYDIIRQDFLSILFKINIQKILMNIFTKAWLEEVVKEYGKNDECTLQGGLLL